MRFVRIAGLTNYNGITSQSGCIGDGNYGSCMYSSNVFQICKLNLEGFRSSKSSCYDFIACSNLISINKYFDSVSLEAESCTLLIMEGKLVSVSIVGIIFSNGSGQPEWNIIADVIVSRIFPINCIFRVIGVVLVVNLLVRGGCAFLRGNLQIGNNLNKVE